MGYNDSPEQIAATAAARIGYARLAIKVAVVSFVVLILLIWGWKWATPKYNLYRSNTEKQAVIKEQEAISEAEVYAAQKRVIAATAEADARRIEAQGIADSQAVIAETLTPEYLRWRFYEVLATTSNATIYIPTEAGLPITEAARLDDDSVSVTVQGGD